MSKLNYKFVVILNKKVPAGAILNATAHMAAALVNKAAESQRKQMEFIDYYDADSGIHPISACSLIVLQADNSNKIRQARDLAQKGEVIFVDFIETMTQDTYIEQMTKTSSLKEVELEYWGLAIFGTYEDLGPITKKFSLWR